MDTIEQLLQRGQQAQGGVVSQAPMNAPEAERIISQLAPLSIEEVGGAKWQKQHDWIERLNLQAHYNAQTNSDEFVVELLVSLDKLHVLVHDLLLIEAWKDHVYPLLAAHLAERVDSVLSYVLLYHEVSVANLLQVCLFHSHAAESLSEDYALEVADWCSRKLVRLNAEGHKLAERRDRSAEELMRQSRLEEQEDKRREVEFSVLMCSLGILRYVTDALPRMPMGALSRLVSTNDTLMALLPLLDRPPWMRTRVPAAGGGGGGGGRPVLEKWAGNRWVAVPPADRLKITQMDGQVWLAVTNLLVEPRCRAKYGLDEFRRERILGLRRRLNELMFDQLPPLRDLQRVIDELALGVLPDQGGAGRAGSLILEAVPVVREAMLRGRNWRQVAERAREEHFGRAAERMARERIEAMVKNLDLLCDLEPEPPAAGPNGAAAAAAPQPHPPVKVATWRKVHDSGVYEPWYDFAMEVDDSKPPEPVEVAAAAGGGGGASKAGGGAAAAVQGLRYRLRPLDVDATRPLPANGKAVVRWGSLVAEALLQLPELPTRDSGEGAAVLWVTVGLLALDGLALQVKLKKAPKPKERDRVAGVWYAYHPVAGALTVLRDEVASAAAAAPAPAPAPAPGPGLGRDSGMERHKAQAGRPQGEAAPTPQSAKGAAVSDAKSGAAAAVPARPLIQVVAEPAVGRGQQGEGRGQEGQGQGSAVGANARGGGTAAAPAATGAAPAATSGGAGPAAADAARGGTVEGPAPTADSPPQQQAEQRQREAPHQRCASGPGQEPGAAGPSETVRAADRARAEGAPAEGCPTGAGDEGGAAAAAAAATASSPQASVAACPPPDPAQPASRAGEAPPSAATGAPPPPPAAPAPTTTAGTGVSHTAEACGPSCTGVASHGAGASPQAPLAAPGADAVDGGDDNDDGDDGPGLDDPE